MVVTFAAALVTMLSATLNATSAAATRLPDLVVSGVTASASGHNVLAHARISNRGTAVATATRAAIFLSLDTHKGSGDEQLGSVRTARLAAGSSQRIAATLPVPVRIKQASYHLIVCADSPRSVTEQREDNNCAASPGTIKAGTPRVIVSATADTGGSIAASSVVAGTCSGTACSFPAGAGAVTFTATASSGYRFGEWTGSTCAQHSGSATDSAITFTNPTAAHSCVAVFVKQVVVHWSAYLQWAQVGGCGQQPSTQPGSCTVDAGGTVVLVVKPETGFTFTGQWTATGGLPCDAGQSTFLPDGTAQVALTNLSTDESCEAQMQVQ